jgi:hypothetical protein
MSTNVVAKPAVVREPGSHEVTVFFLESSKRVLWIEADMKFVDILLNFLLLPVGAAVQALSRQGRAPVPPGYGEAVLCFTFIEAASHGVPLNKNLPLFLCLLIRN